METFRRETSDNQTDSVVCGVGSTCGGWHGGGRFLHGARNDKGFARRSDLRLRIGKEDLRTEV